MQYFHSELGAPLGPPEVDTLMTVGETVRVPFTKDEVDVVKLQFADGGAGIKLLFFAPLSVLKPELNTTSPYFLFPDEKRVKGNDEDECV